MQSIVLHPQIQCGAENPRPLRQQHPRRGRRRDRRGAARQWGAENHRPQRQLAWHGGLEWCAIFAALRDNKKNKIESWDLTRQGINAEVAKVLAEYVSGSAVMTNLWLGDNNIGDEGAKALAAALRVNGVLTDLNLFNNKIGPEGGVAIGKALAVSGVLKPSTSATTIHLRRGRRRDRPGAARQRGADQSRHASQRDLGRRRAAACDSCARQLIARALRLGAVEGAARKHTLDRLDLSHEYLGVPEALVLAKLVEGSGVLTSIDLRGNNLSDEENKAIQGAVSGREGFKLLMRVGSESGDGVGGRAWD